MSVASTLVHTIKLIISTFPGRHTRFSSKLQVLYIPYTQSGLKWQQLYFQVNLMKCNSFRVSDNLNIAIISLNLFSQRG